MTPRDDPDRRLFLQASLAAGWASFAGTAGRLMADPPAATATPSAAAGIFGRVRKARMRSLLPVPMRDGVRLATTVFLPEAPGRHPTVLIRTSYGRLGQLNGWQDWTSGGYALGAAEPSAEPAESTPDRYDYDPDRPMPTRGGNHSVGPWDDSYKKLIWCGPCDQSPNEDRDDMLVYTSSPLEADLEVTGPVVVKLWASSSAPDTDFVARLVDVHPDDRAINITEGVIRARFRAGDWSRPQLIEPGAVLEYTIDLQATSNVFRAGHRIRLEVTSSNFPLWDRNLNTGEHPYRGTRKAVARQTVWHDAERPSRLILPVIP
jgi:predicted acyl esterase